MAGGSGGIEQNGKKIQGHGQQCGDWGEGCIVGLNGTQKYNKIILKKEKKKKLNDPQSKNVKHHINNFSY